MRLAPASILDLGCGEGLVASRLRETGLRFEYTGVDLSPDAVARAREREPGLRFEVGDVLGARDLRADVVLCLEVLEHLEDPRAAVKRLAASARQAVLVSVPWEPWFRLGNLARGKYLAHLGNHPEHVQAFGRSSLAALLAQELEDVRVEPCLPWLLAVGRPRG